MDGIAGVGGTAAALRDCAGGGAMQPLLSVNGLVKHFRGRRQWRGGRRDVRAVDGVTFDLGKGETLGVVGESGCGKSTLARLIMRIVAADSGGILFDGETVGPESALDKSIEAQVLNLLIDLKAEFALTYIFISHDLNVVRVMSDRVMVMYLGKIAEIGSAEVILRSPRHPYTMALLASMPSMDPERRTAAAPLSGDPPDPIDPPSGCRFLSRY
jgi:oligopeptide/dipeptide ABC transporter ATP-binding protein